MTLSCRVLLNIYIDVELQRFEMPHKMGKHLAIDMLAQAPRVESPHTPAVLSGGTLESGCSSNGQGWQSASSGCLFHLQPASSQVTRA